MKKKLNICIKFTSRMPSFFLTKQELLVKITQLHTYSLENAEILHPNIYKFLTAKFTSLLFTCQTNTPCGYLKLSSHAKGKEKHTHTPCASPNLPSYDTLR